jgi:hypothetical protein
MLRIIVEETAESPGLFISAVIPLRDRDNRVVISDVVAGLMAVQEQVCRRHGLGGQVSWLVQRPGSPA